MRESSPRATVTAEAARAGGSVALEEFRSAVPVETKANKNDVVTWVDRAAQEAVIDRIERQFPDEPIVAEEADTDESDDPTPIPETGPAWVIDPIDGTANYIRGMRLWATSVATVVDGEPEAAATVLPATGDEYLADRALVCRNGDRVSISERSDPETFAVSVLGWGPLADRSTYATLATAVITRFGDLRRFGSMQTALACIASGELEGAITNRPPTPWDSIAGAHLIEQGGGVVTDLDGDPWRFGSGVMVASNGTCHDELLAAAREGLG